MAQALLRQGGTAHRGLAPITRSAGARPLVVRRVAGTRGSRKQVAVNALFSFLTPKAPAAPKVDPRAGELVDELIDICSRTAAGSKASDSTKEQIAELVGGSLAWAQPRGGEGLACAAAAAAAAADRWDARMCMRRLCVARVACLQAAAVQLHIAGSGHYMRILHHARWQLEWGRRHH